MSAPTPIRTATEQDGAGLLDIYGPIVRDTAISFELEVPSIEEMARRIRDGVVKHPWLVWDDSGIAGYAYASTLRARAAYAWSVEVSVYVDTARQRAGIGRELYGALLRVLRRQGYFGVFAGIRLPSPESVALHESLGFSRIGVFPEVGFKFGEWHDVGWWRLSLTVNSADPAPPVPFSELGSSSSGSAKSVHCVSSFLSPDMICGMNNLTLPNNSGSRLSRTSAR